MSSKATVDRSPTVASECFQVDACGIVTTKRQHMVTCLPCNKSSRAVELGFAYKWDHKPRSMNTLEFVLRYFQVYSRMLPDDKALLVQQLQSLPNCPIVVSTD